MRNHSTFNIRHSTSKALPHRMLIVLTMVVGCALNSAAQSTNAPTKLTYDSFRTIGDRNIFNPNRYSRGSSRTNSRTSSTPASRVESFTLVGIIAYEKGWFAFFDGTKSDYKHALQAEGAIGEYKVVLVTPDAVKLAAGTNTYELKVGMQMRREDEGDWFLSEGGEAVRKRIVSTRTRTRISDTEASNGNSIGGGAVERLLQAVAEPEIIVIDTAPQAEQLGGENHNPDGDAVHADNESEPTDPVLRTLMERRRNALNQ